MQIKYLKKFKLKNLGDYHDLYVQSDKLLLEDVLENFRNKYIEIYELESFFICVWINMASMFKENRSKTRIVN